LSYKTTYDDKQVQKIAGAINNIMRFKAFLSYGKNYKFDKQQQDDYRGAINFLADGTAVGIRNELYRLLYGFKTAEDEYSRSSIFDNLSSLINDILSDPFSEDYEGLVDDYGKIQNEMLLYVLPQAASR